MTLTITDLPVPLRSDAGGVLRVGNTRVGLDLVIAAFRDGAGAEEIVQQWPTLDLADVCAVISFYLYNQADVDAYLAAHQRAAEEIRASIEATQRPDPLRARLRDLRARSGV